MNKYQEGVAMKRSLEQCHICRDVYTTQFVEIENGATIYVCGACTEKAKDNFIWLCISCGKVYMKPKDLVITRVKDHELKKAYMLCQDLQLIQGIDRCITCDPERIVEYMATQYAGFEC